MRDRLLTSSSSLMDFEWVVVDKERFPIELREVNKSNVEGIAAVLEEVARMFREAGSRYGVFRYCWKCRVSSPCRWLPVH